MNVADETNHRVTNQDLGRRVGSLEVAVGEHGDQLHELRNQMNVLGLRVEHAQTLTSAKFEQVLAQGGAHGEQLARVIERMDTATREAFAADAEPAATPAGRTLLEAISSIQSDSKSAREWTLKASGVIAALLVVLSLFGPAIQNALRLPQ